MSVLRDQLFRDIAKLPWIIGAGYLLEDFKKEKMIQNRITLIVLIFLLCDLIKVRKMPFKEK
jgi:hypothetical protein